MSFSFYYDYLSLDQKFPVIGFCISCGNYTVIELGKIQLEITGFTTAPFFAKFAKIINPNKFEQINPLLFKFNAGDKYLCELDIFRQELKNAFKNNTEYSFTIGNDIKFTLMGCDEFIINNIHFFDYENISNIIDEICVVFECLEENAVEENNRLAMEALEDYIKKKKYR